MSWVYATGAGAANEQGHPTRSRADPRSHGGARLFRDYPSCPPSQVDRIPARCHRAIHRLAPPGSRSASLRQLHTPTAPSKLRAERSWKGGDGRRSQGLGTTTSSLWQRPGTVMIPLDDSCLMMAEDGAFEASGGQDVNGERHVLGQQAVRAAFAAVFARYPECPRGQRTALRQRGSRRIRVDVHRNARGRHASRGHRLRLADVQERQDRAQKRVQKESTTGTHFLESRDVARPPYSVGVVY